MENRTLNFKKDAIQELSLEELKSTVKEENYNGQPVMGMYHFDFIENVCETVEKAGLNHNIQTIWAAQNQDKTRPGATVIERYREEYGENSVQSYLLRRIFSTIEITDMEDDETSTSIALSYNQLGFQLGFGPHVKVCRNQCIMSANHFMSTYGSNDKMPNPQKIIEVLANHLNKFKEERQWALEMINRFKDIAVSHTEVLEIIGDLTTMRIKKENSKFFPKQSLNPLNQGQIGRFTKDYLLKAQEDNYHPNAWNIYNLATEMYKPGDTDIPNILSANNAMSSYLIDRYSIN